MEKKLLFAMTLTLAWHWTATAKGLDEYQLELDSNEGYSINDYDFNKLSKFPDDDRKINSNHDDTYDSEKSKINTSGFKKKKTYNNGLNSQHSIDDLKRFFKMGSSHDDEHYSDDDAHEISEGKAIKRVKVTEGEERKYKKGTKTRGFHRVQHKDEYKKDKEIYEDDETSGTIKKKGVKGLGLAFDAGVGHIEGNYHSDHNKGLRGKQDYFDKGRSSKQDKEYSSSQGFEAYFDSE